jgi:hypothetical protein
MTSDTVSEDNRKSLRRRVGIPCTVELSENVSPGRLLDLSEGGSFVQTELTVTCGTVLSIIFRAGAAGEIVDLNLKAKVVYVGRFVQGYENFYGFGVKFEALPDTTVEALTALLESLQTEPQRKYEFM